MPAPFELLSYIYVNRVSCGFPLLCFTKFVLLVRFVVFLVVFSCMRHCPLGYIYICNI